MFIYMFILKSVSYWYQESLFYILLILVSRAWIFSIYACLFISLYQSLFCFILISREFVLCFVDIGIKSMDRTYFVVLFCWYQELLLKILLLVSRAFIDYLSIEIFIGIKSNYSKNMFILSLYFQLVFKNMFILKRRKSNLF